MMSRRSALASLSSSRQMMIAWKVSGLSQRPAIIASRPASMRLAIAISPSRDKSSTAPISRRYIRTGSSVRSMAHWLRIWPATRCGASMSSFSPSSPPRRPRGRFSSRASASSLSTTLIPMSESMARMSSICSDDFLGGQHRVELLMGDEASLLGGLIIRFDGGIRQVEKRRRISGRFRRLLLGASSFSFPFGPLGSSCSPMLSYAPRSGNTYTTQYTMLNTRTLSIRRAVPLPYGRRRSLPPRRLFAAWVEGSHVG